MQRCHWLVPSATTRSFPRFSPPTPHPPPSHPRPLRCVLCLACAGCLQRGSWSYARAHLNEARRHSLTVLPALAQESYVRAYPHMLRLHTVQVTNGMVVLWHVPLRVVCVGAWGVVVYGRERRLGHARARAVPTHRKAARAGGVGGSMAAHVCSRGMAQGWGHLLLPRRGAAAVPHACMHASACMRHHMPASQPDPQLPHRLGPSSVFVCLHRHYPTPTTSSTRTHRAEGTQLALHFFIIGTGIAFYEMVSAICIQQHVMPPLVGILGTPCTTTWSSASRRLRRRCLTCWACWRAAAP